MLDVASSLTVIFKSPVLSKTGRSSLNFEGQKRGWTCLRVGVSLATKLDKLGHMQEVSTACCASSMLQELQADACNVQPHKALQQL